MPLNRRTIHFQMFSFKFVLTHAQIRIRMRIHTHIHMHRRVDGSAGSVILTADGISTILANDKGALTSRTMSLNDLNLSHDAGVVRLADQSAGGDVVQRIKEFPFQELMRLIDEASRLMGLR